jgi:putative transposase
MHTYAQVKALGRSAQPAQHVIKKVTDAYKLDRQRRRVFRPGAAQPFDDRCRLSWQVEQRTVSIWTTAGRRKGVRFTCGDHQRAMLACRKGESDLVYRDRTRFLYATCEVPEAPRAEPDGFLGADLGIVNIATTSDGHRHAGRQLNRVRHRNRRLRAKLQRKGTKSTKRLLKRRRRKEARFASDTNHCIAKRIVAEAQRTGRGIAWKTSRASAAGYGSAGPSGPRCTRGRSTSSARSSPTRPGRPGWRSSTWTRRTPPRRARTAGTSARPTGPTRPRLLPVVRLR